MENWLTEQKAIYGNAFEVEPLKSFEHKNPLVELAKMTDKPIIGVVTK